MKAVITWWDLNDSEQTIDSLRKFLRDGGVQPWSSVRGLRLKFWISDRDTNRWGAVMLWESANAIDQPLPPNHAAKLIGYPPTLRASFDIDATIEGIFSLSVLTGLGLALDNHPFAVDSVTTTATETDVSGIKPKVFTESVDPLLFEFDVPPADPIDLFHDWLDGATAKGVREPTALALATADAHGRASNRIVRVESITDEGLMFTSHVSSRKGRDIAATAWGSGVFYWRETQQQVIFSGLVEQLSDAESDVLWVKRPIAAQAASAVSHQSAVLDDEQKLRVEVQHLIHVNEPIPRPRRWSGYRLVPASIEFWHGSLDRLHHRLRYDLAGDRWSTSRLQP